jgi:hypothetical protein
MGKREMQQHYGKKVMESTRSIRDILTEIVEYSSLSDMELRQHLGMH